MISYETRIGSINVSNDYFSKLVGHAVSSCYGVVGMVSHGKQRLFEMVFKHDSQDKGVKVRGNMNSIDVEVHIVVTYGMNINAIAKSIVNKIKYTIKEVTGIEVGKVIVKVDGIKN